MRISLDGFIIRGWDVVFTGWRCLDEPHVGVSTSWGAVSARENTVFVLGVLELSLYGRISDPGMGRYLYRMAMAPRTSGWGFHTVGGGIDQGDQCFGPRFVNVVDL